MSDLLIPDRDPTQREIDIAKRILVASGHVVLRAKSYHQAQERQRVAEAEAQWARSERDSATAWGRDCLASERQMRDRCAFLYGMARAVGCSVDDLRGVE